MKTQTLIRWSGMVSLLAGVLYALAALIHPAGEDVASILLSTWIPAHVIGTFSALLMLFGLTGLFVRQAVKTGWSGLVGFILAFVGSAFLMTEEAQSVTLPYFAVK